MRSRPAAGAAPAGRDLGEGQEPPDWGVEAVQLLATDETTPPHVHDATSPAHCVIPVTHCHGRTRSSEATTRGGRVGGVLDVLGGGGEREGGVEGAGGGVGAVYVEDDSGEAAGLEVVEAGQGEGFA